MISQKKIPHTTTPSKSEGRDNDIRFVADRSGIYLYYKYNGEWYRTKMEKV